MGEEGDHGLALPVVFFDEGVEKHRYVAPPVGITDEYGVIFLDIHIALDGGAGVAVQLFLGQIDAFLVVVRVGFLWHDLEQCATGFLSNHLGDDFSVAFVDVADGVVLSGAGEIHN